MQRPTKIRVLPVRRKEDRADHIYRVAAEVMCQKGYEATSMNDIADAVGLTKAGIYHYIRGKEDLLFQIMGFGMDMVDQDVIGPAKEIEDPEERLRAIARRHATRILEAGGAVTILLTDDMHALSPAHSRAIFDRQRVYLQFIKETLAALDAQGKLRDINPSVAAATILGMICWLGRWYNSNGRMTAEQVVRDFVEMVMHAVVRS